MAMAAAEPSPAAVMTWARGLTTLPAAQTPGTLVRPVVSTSTQPSSSVAQPRSDEQVVVGDERGADEQRVARHDPAVVQLDAGQPVVLDDEPLDGALDDADGAGDELSRCSRGEVCRW